MSGLADADDAFCFLPSPCHILWDLNTRLWFIVVERMLVLGARIAAECLRVMLAKRRSQLWLFGLRSLLHDFALSQGFGDARLGLIPR